MDIQSVSNITIVGMVVSLIISFALPIGLLIYGKVKGKGKIACALIGATTFFVAALVLESAFHFAFSSITGIDIKANPYFLAIYGGICAALFEETARFIAMKYFLKKNLTFNNAFMYGVGHGGIEAILTTGITEINYIVYAVMINNGVFDTVLEAVPANQKDAVIAQITPVMTGGAETFAGGIERISAIVLHISLSILVYMAVRYQKKRLVALAYGLHFAADAAVVLVNHQLGLWATEAVFFVVVLIVTGMVCKLKKSLDKE